MRPGLGWWPSRKYRMTFISLEKTEYGLVLIIFWQAGLKTSGVTPQSSYTSTAPTPPHLVWTPGPGCRTDL